MKAMILAAGKGERMRPLTEHTPKPLLEIAGKPMLQYHIDALVAAGIAELVINHGPLGHLIEERFGDGAELGARIVYSAEGEQPLETGGGICRALPLLGDKPFLVVNGDIWCDYRPEQLALEGQQLACLLLVANPDHNTAGDFHLHQGLALNEGQPRRTFAGVALYHPRLFENAGEGRFPLAPLLRAAAEKHRVGARLHPGRWLDVGTPERLEMANSMALELK